MRNWTRLRPKLLSYVPATSRATEKLKTRHGVVLFSDLSHELAVLRTAQPDLAGISDLDLCLAHHTLLLPSTTTNLPPGRAPTSSALFRRLVFAV